MKVYIPISTKVWKIILGTSIAAFICLSITVLNPHWKFLTSISYYEEIGLLLAVFAGIGFGIANSRIMSFVSFTKTAIVCTAWTGFCFLIKFLNFNSANISLWIGSALGIFIDRSYLNTKQKIPKEIMELIDSIGA
jgi:lipoprotein signal peptidase